MKAKRPSERSAFGIVQNYQSIDTSLETKEEAIQTSKSKRILGFTTLALFFFMSGVFFMSWGQPSNVYMQAGSPSEMFQAGTCGPCSFIQCKASLCDSTISPYECTKGAGLGGCQKEEITWSKSGVCAECCSTKDCQKTVDAGDTDDTVAPCTDCTIAQCASLAKVSSQMCYKSAPYVCVSGSSRMGCSADAYHWPAMANTQCNECCNQLTCAKK